MAASKLNDVLARLASEFASGVLDAIRGASLEAVLSETRADGGRRRPPPQATASPPSAGRRARGGGSRLERRSPDDIAALVARIVAVLKQHPNGLRAEQIREKLGADAKEMPRPLAQALAERQVTKRGQKRATTYFVGGTAAGGRRAAARPSGARVEAKKQRTKPPSSGARNAPQKRRGAMVVLTESGAAAERGEQTSDEA